MTPKTTRCNAHHWAVRLLLVALCTVACATSQAAPCLGLRVASTPAPGLLADSPLHVHAAPSARVDCVTLRSPYPPQSQTASTVVIYISVTLAALWRRERSLEQLIAEARGVRKNPNRWLGKVLGTAPTQHTFATQHAAPAFAAKQTVRHSLHTGTKHATVRRSRYL